MRPLYLERWIHQQTGAADRPGIESYQLAKLRQALDYAFERSDYYRRLFGQRGLHPDQIRNLRDLHNFPFTEPEDLALQPHRFLCVSQAEIRRPVTFVTSGTTGPQKRVFWTRGDIEKITDFMAAGIRTVADSSDVVQILLPDGRPESQADLLRQGVLKMGAKAVVVPGGTGEEQLKAIRQNRTTVMFGYAGRLFRLSKELQNKLDLRSMGIKALFLAAEYVPECRRRELEQIWDCRVHTHYGLTEMGLGVAVECEARHGYHFNEAGLLLEVVDPATGAPLAAGLEGELVFTTLTREAMPLIRYRTHDISRRIPEPCPCGASTLLRIDAVKRRAEAALRLHGGREIYPALLDDALFAVPGIVDYQAAVTLRSGRECLEVAIETAGPSIGVAEHAQSQLIPLLEPAQVRVRLLPPGPADTTGTVKKKIVDRRQGN